MTTSRLKDNSQFSRFLSSIYLGITAFCAVLVFSFGGTVQSTSYLILFVLSLPWSLVAILLSWGLAPAGDGMRGIVIIYLIFAGINAGIIYWLGVKVFKGKSDESA